MVPPPSTGRRHAGRRRGGRRHRSPAASVTVAVAAMSVVMIAASDRSPCLPGAAPAICCSRVPPPGRGRGDHRAGPVFASLPSLTFWLLAAGTACCIRWESSFIFGGACVSRTRSGMPSCFSPRSVTTRRSLNMRHWHWHEKIWRMSVFGYGSVSKTVELAELIVISTSVEANSAAVLTPKSRRAKRV